MYVNLVAGDVLQNAIIRGWGTAPVMLGLQAINGHSKVRVRQEPPRSRNRPDCTRDKLESHRHVRQFRKDGVQLPISYPRLAADNRDVQGTQPPNPIQDAVD